MMPRPNAPRSPARTQVLAMTRLTDAQVARLDLIVPPRGPCGFCGGPDARHRLFDSVRENVAAGDSPDFVADIYGLPPEAVELILIDR